jgi:hypothetical protein
MGRPRGGRDHPLEPLSLCLFMGRPRSGQIHPSEPARLRLLMVRPQSAERAALVVDAMAGQ